jgi:hypothetical protein
MYEYYRFLHVNTMSRDNSVDIALGYGLDDLGSRVRFPAGAGNFSLHHRLQNGSGAHLASYPMVPGAISLGVKRPGREADYSHPSSAEVKSEWCYTSTPQYTLMAWYSVNKSTGTTSPLPLPFTCSHTCQVPIYEGRLQNSLTGGSVPLLCRERRWLLCRVVVVGTLWRWGDGLFFE